MAEFDSKGFSIHGLLCCFAEILDELKERSVVRTLNNPVSDYAEWLVAKKMDLKLVSNSNSGYDAKDAKGNRFQIKSRRLSPKNNSRQLGVIRKLNSNEFDYLIGVIFNKDFIVEEAYKIPQGVIDKFAPFNEHQNGHILHLRGDVLKALGVENITNIIKDDNTATV
jgi:hypothetical protein